MANYWAITIGINQYRHLQPLMHAQNDALFMHRFFTQTVGVPAHNCVLLSDLATSVGHQVVYPDKPALSEWVQTITQQVQPDDTLWFFFSGYGVQLEGADYLMPIDGDPGQIKETGLAAVNLIETLAQLPTQKTLLVLDINRSQGSFAGQTIGKQVSELAATAQVPLLLSCQPEQYSHETFGVRHGLFTAALLEALQQKCTTLGQLNEYVSKRLPELCEHHWRPIQNPVGLIPEDQQSVVIVPDRKRVTDVAASSAESPADSTAIAGREPSLSAAGIGAGSRGVYLGSDQGPVGQETVRQETVRQETVGREVGREMILAGSGGALLGVADDRRDDDFSSDPTLLDRDRKNTSALTQRNAGSSAIIPLARESAPERINGTRLRNWGLAALALLMIGVLLKQPFVRAAWQGLTEQIAAIGGDSSEDSQAATDPVDSEQSAVGQSADAQTESVAATAQTSEPSGETASADEPEADAVSPEASDTSADASGPTRETSTAPASARTEALLAEANKALAQRQYSEALITLQLVPKDQRDSTFSSVLTRARAGAAEAQQYNASVLTDARTSIQPTQASQFTDAIAKARLIKPGEPYYEEAQQDIRSWSQIILDIAEGRATSGNLDGAIAAATVMPYDNAEFYQKAQDRIVFWQRRQQSRDIIISAQAIPRSGQASTYQKGIVKLGEVPIEHPEYETAQRLSDEWSDRIFSIAQARAAQGRRRAAIQAAILVPAGTTAYEPTQQAIRRWQTEE